jgi:hypothetical protein
MRQPEHLDALVEIGSPAHPGHPRGEVRSWAEAPRPQLSNPVYGHAGNPGSGLAQTCWRPPTNPSLLVEEQPGSGLGLSLPSTRDQPQRAPTSSCLGRVRPCRQPPPRTRRKRLRPAAERSRPRAPTRPGDRAPLLGDFDRIPGRDLVQQSQGFGLELGGGHLSGHAVSVPVTSAGS